MQRKLRYEAVVSIDLGWSPENTTRTAAAFWRPGKVPWWTKPVPQNPVEIQEVVSLFAGEKTLVLLDIPIYGTEGLSKSNAFRPLDKILQCCGIPLYPSFRAGNLGQKLATEIGGISANLEVVESYPNPIYRFMWLARDENLSLEGKLEAIAKLKQWKRVWPPNPKKGKLPERRERLARQIEVMGRFLPGDYSSLLPGPENKTKELDSAGDICDALMALRVGIAMAQNSPWVLEARIEGHAEMIPLLADINLRRLWEDSVRRFQSTESSSPR